jgi:tetrahydromethanopterin S-methyltransferase subunit G
MKPAIVVIILLIFAFVAKAQNHEIPYTLADRERLIRVEERLDALNEKIDVKGESSDAKFQALEPKFKALESKIQALESKMDIKFDGQQRQLDDIKTLFYWGFGILITLFIFMLGYMIWNRRTALKPALDKAVETESRTKSFLVVLREYAVKHPELAEIMRTHGLL